MSDPHEVLYEKIYEKTFHDVKRDLLRAMKKAGVHKIEAEYSGGHDEGGIQAMFCWDAAGNLVPLKPASWEHPLWQACDQVMSTKYYTWALEGYVTGHLFVDLGERRLWTVGEEEHTEYRPMEDPIEWKL